MVGPSHTSLLLGLFESDHHHRRPRSSLLSHNRHHDEPFVDGIENGIPSLSPLHFYFLQNLIKRCSNDAQSNVNNNGKSEINGGKWRPGAILLPRMSLSEMKNLHEDHSLDCNSKIVGYRKHRACLTAIHTLSLLLVLLPFTNLNFGWKNQVSGRVVNAVMTANSIRIYYIFHSDHLYWPFGRWSYGERSPKSMAHIHKHSDTYQSWRSAEQTDAFNENFKSFPRPQFLGRFIGCHLLRSICLPM